MIYVQSTLHVFVNFLVFVLYRVSSESARGFTALWMVENSPSPLLWPVAYTTACTTVQAVILQSGAATGYKHTQHTLMPVAN